jgi:hypothetical protein
MDRERLATRMKIAGILGLIIEEQTGMKYMP